MSDSDEEAGGFLSGWSRRKLAAKRQELAPPPVPEEEREAEPLEISAVEVEDEELIASLPSLDEITAGFDIKPFLAKGVPARLKNAAMRKLWLASPSVRDYVDPAMDYAWDWNAPGGVPGGGGVLSEQSVAKMVKDLIGGPKPEAEQTADAVVQDADLLEPVEERDEADITAQASYEVADPVRLSAKAVPPEAGAAFETAPREAIKPAPRRHGGAAPE